MLTLFKHVHPILNAIPGPLALAATNDGVLWAAGGGRGFSAVLRYTEPTGWVSRGVDAQGLRAVLPLSNESVLVVGEYGYAAVVGPGDDERTFSTGTRECLFTVARDADGKVWAAGDNGVLLQLRVGAVLESEPVSSGTSDRIVQLDFTGPKRVMVTSTQVLFGAKSVLSAKAPLTRFARAPDGSCAVAGDQGQLFVGPNIESLTPCDASALGGADVECVVYDPTSSTFVVGSKNAVGHLVAGAVSLLGTLVDAGSVTSLLPWKRGLVGSAWLQTGAPFRFRGTAFYVGPDEDAPSRILEPARQPLPERRERTVGVETTTFLTEDDGETISLDEAKRRLPGVSWPDTQHTEVRYFAGSVRVKTTDRLLAETCDMGFAVVIKGDLVVDGYLDGGAGGDGYDSILVVDGSIWAESAYFRSCITVVCRLLEVATVIMCAYGDNGGSLWVDSVRAQVFHYATYFSKPSGPIDAFCVGDVYGERSFPPERGAEVFVTDVLKGGQLDERIASDWLEQGRPIVRPAPK